MTWEGDRREGHSTAGQAALATTWWFAEGNTGHFATYVAVVNPHATAVPLVLGYYHENGTLYFVGASVPAQSRATILTPEWLPAGSFGLIVGDQSGLGIAAERVLYGGAGWTLGTAGVGTQPQTGWSFAEGEPGPGWDTFFLVANLSPTAANVVFAFTSSGGTPYYFGLTVPPQSRRTVEISALGLGASFRTLLGANVPIVVERATYWAGQRRRQRADERWR